ncbi:MAG: SPOR domain-containing protein [Ignavibacterium sp.]|jgi:cell division septation protein DedD/nucleoid DNA-binding protein|nr:SPOR domain-containing protein [Ignavibacterium sp.]
MTKAELIRKLAKNSGIPDQDAKIFFELLLKRISSDTKIGQSLFLSGFGYFHLIKGSIKKPAFSYRDNEVSEEEIDLILFSEDSDLKNSNTKGLVFSIPFTDDDNFHPIDTAFSLSIGKPLIPLRGVPFDDIYIPTSGYEYRRLIESKVDKVVTSAVVAELAENFPILVIDARSYNSNQIQLKWNDYTDTEISDEKLPDEQTVQKSELSEYEKQTQELKNIAWDFGEDLSKQIEVESILDIADEKISFDLNQKKEELIQDEIKQKEFNEEKTETLIEDSFIEIGDAELTKPVEVSLSENVDNDSSQKLDELLSFDENTDEVKSELTEIISSESAEPVLSQSDISENNSDLLIDELNIDEMQIDEVTGQNIEIIETPDTAEDKQFWENTSKYFETYTPDKTQAEKENDEAVISSDTEQVIENPDYSEKPEEDIITELAETYDENIKEAQAETNRIELSVDESEDEDKEDVKEQTEQKAEYYEPVERKNYLPFIIFPLIVIVLSLALYWYLEFYQKKGNPVRNINISLNTANTTVIKRDYDIPVSIPYPVQTEETTLEQNTIASEEIEKEEVKKEEPVINEKTEKQPETKIEKKEVKPEVPVKIPESKPLTTTSTITNNKALNVGNNIFKYGDHFVVQVASFRVSSISENEAGKYRNKGYNAFVETAEIRGRGIWYRVRVGNFSTKEEAQNFINKNIRP